MNNFTPEDLNFMRQRGTAPDDVYKQLDNFERGFPFAELECAATVYDGILQMEDDMADELLADYENMKAGKKVVKFVPASGAATRMFKELYTYLSDDSEEVHNKALMFLQTLPKYPFYEALKNVMRQNGYGLEHELEKGNYKLIIGQLLNEDGLNYGNNPKGLLPFHRYADFVRTPVEEHLVEAALYAATDGQCYLHFTVSPQHLDGFKQLLERVVPVYQEKYGVTYHIDYSIQEPATDTIAVELDNTPFRDENGQLLFRPAGHGALIHNLNRLDADLVFVKNIDNVITEDRIAPTVRYKQILAAYLLQLQARAFQYLKAMEQGPIDNMLLGEILDFAETDLMISLNDDYTQEYLMELLNRPMRVCGMVKNEGEPGGGPFWVDAPDGGCSLQIVESSQVDKNNPEQYEIMQKATHFNPVDMVCGLKNYQGEHFDLLKYVDEQSGFISMKSYNGRSLRAMELPGLWNGAMSDWITIFVEVPIETFNPVKTVFDLLKRV